MHLYNPTYIFRKQFFLIVDIVVDILNEYYVKYNLDNIQHGWQVEN